MRDSDQEPSYNLSKNLLLLPRILKLIKNMVDDSTPLVTASKEILPLTVLKKNFVWGKEYYFFFYSLNYIVSSGNDFPSSIRLNRKQNNK